jgi:hypothetical protein
VSDIFSFILKRNLSLNIHIFYSFGFLSVFLVSLASIPQSIFICECIYRQSFSLLTLYTSL